MAKAAQIKGVDTLIAKLKGKMRKEKAAAFRRGIVECAVQLLRYSKPLVPVVTGVLRASGDVHISGAGFQSVAHTSYGTDYAIPVHEIPSPDVTHGSEFNQKHASKITRIRKARKKAGLAKSKYWFNRGTKQQYKFLEQPFREHRSEFLSIIKDELEAG